MSVTRDMLATYRGPHKVVERLIGTGPREDRALAILMAGCAVVFVAQWPRLAREAHLGEQELQPLLGGALMAWIFIAPLALYAIAFLSYLLLRALRRPATGFGTRIALFWALLAASPILLLFGLVAGFVGPGAALNAVGVLWLCVFLWFWIAGLVQAGRGSA